LPHPGALAVNAEVGRLGADAFVAWAAAAMIEAREHPDSFGPHESVEAANAGDDRQKKLSEKLQRLEQERAWLRAALALPEAAALRGGAGR
jgi:hypothetical protein